MNFFKKLFGGRDPAQDVDQASANEISLIVSLLEQSGADGNFAVFLFVPPGATDDEAVHLEYSIEGGVVGFDWTLIAPRNIADKAKIIEFASERGYRLEEREMNNVRYLRRTGPGISELGIAIIRDLYHIDPSTKFDIIAEGFTWRP